MTGAVFRIAVLDDYQRVASTMADWSLITDRAEVTFFHDNARGPALVSRLAGFDAVVLMRERTRVTGEVLERLPNLRLIVTSGFTNAALDITAAHELGITVCGTQSWAGVTATVEHTWGLILSVVRGIPAEDAAIRNGGWMIGLGPALAGKTLGIIGLGNLGALVPPVARALGMEVVAWSRNLTAARAAEVGARRLDHDEFFATADVATIHIKESERSRHYIGEPELRAMKPTAYLVNTSRGSVLDTAALVTALEERWIAGAALDVFDDEPLPLDHPLRRQPRTVLTPHMGYATLDSYREYFTQIIEDIDAYLRDVPRRVL